MSIAKHARGTASIVLAGDIGGTGTRLGLFDARPRRPRLIVEQEFVTADVARAPGPMRAFIDEALARGGQVVSACFGVAGPVIGDAAELTNADWRITSSGFATIFGIGRIAIINDLLALAHAVPVLEDAELHTLQDGDADARGSLALIAAGTGLGESFLHRVKGALVAAPSEAGNSDWAPRTERDIAVLRDLVRRFGRAAVERVVSGPGLVNVYRVTHHLPCTARIDVDDPSAAQAISDAATEGRCTGCVEALNLFVEAYGAEAGNLALRTVSTGGLFVGGGIAPKLLKTLSDGSFMQAFRDKTPFSAMLARIPVKVIVNPRAGLLGAAVFARQFGRQRATQTQDRSSADTG